MVDSLSQWFVQGRDEFRDQAKDAYSQEHRRREDVSASSVGARAMGERMGGWVVERVERVGRDDRYWNRGSPLGTDVGMGVGAAEMARAQERGVKRADVEKKQVGSKYQEFPPTSQAQERVRGNGVGSGSGPEQVGGEGRQGRQTGTGRRDLNGESLRRALQRGERDARERYLGV